MSVFGGPDIITDGLVLHLDAANRKSYPGSGSTWYDLSGNGNNGTINGATFNGGNNGTFSFDGDNDYISINAGFQLGTNEITIAAWVYPTEDSTNGGRTRGSVFGGPGAMYLGLWPNASSGSSAIHTAVQTTSGRPSTQTGTIYTNQWSYLLATYDGSNFKTYLNGEYVTQTTQTGVITTGTVYYVGTYGGLTDGNHTFPGRITFATIYNKYFSEQNILQNFNATKGRYGL